MKRSIRVGLSTVMTAALVLIGSGLPALRAPVYAQDVSDQSAEEAANPAAEAELAGTLEAGPGALIEIAPDAQAAYAAWVADSDLAGIDPNAPLDDAPGMEWVDGMPMARADLPVGLFLPMLQGGTGAIPVDAAEAASPGSAQIAAFGDFNGDGKDDAAIGVPLEDIGSVVNAGQVDVFFGTPAGLSATFAQIWHEDSAGISSIPGTEKRFGSAIAVGDFDKNGRDDLAIGVPNADIGGVTDAGAVHVLYYGGPVNAPKLIKEQYWNQDSGNIDDAAETNDHFGARLAAGDFNQDGYADLVIGVPDEDYGSTVDSGAVHVIYGASGGLSTSNVGHPPDQYYRQGVVQLFGTIKDTPEAGDHFGSVLAVGKLGVFDTIDSLIIGVPNENGNRGVVQILYGDILQGLTAENNSLITQTGIGFTSEPNDQFGRALATGDFDGNGYDDLAIGTPYEDIEAAGKTNVGIVNVLYGGVVSVPAIQSWSQDTSGISDVSENEDYFGYSLAAANFNTGTRDDLVIGVPYEDNGTLTNSGKVHVLFGSTTGLITTGNQLWDQNSTNILDAAEVGDRFGFSVSTGDYNGDGRSDLLVGVPTEDVPVLPLGGTKADAGLAQMILGSNSGLTATGNQLLAQTLVETVEPNDQFGLVQ